MTILRGEIWWASLPEPVASEPGSRRPILVVSSNSFNASRIRTVLAAVLTSNLALAEAPGNVRIPEGESGLARDSVANVTQLVTADKSFLTQRIGSLSPKLMAQVERGLRLVLSL